MGPKLQPGWQTYKEQMTFLCHGDALWEPAPTHNYQRVRLGDVGFIRRGQFHLLFSAGCPLGERQLGIDVPSKFEELHVGAAVFSQPRSPGCLRADTVRGIGGSLSVSVSIVPFLEPGATFSFELTGKRGAALATKYLTYREDVLMEAALERYTKRHYESWVAFAREKQYGNDIQPVIISGVDMTKDFAMAAYSNEGVSLESDLTISIPVVASASASLWGTWHISGSSHTNHGPQQCRPPSHERVTDSSSSQSVDARTTPDEFDQCIFVRYYTMRSRMRFFPKVVRAGAGPHDLGSGDNGSGTFSELTTGSGHESIIGGNEDPMGYWGLIGDDDGSESDIIVRNTPYGEEYDVWDAIADYIFQNSDAETALINHRNVTEIYETGEADDTSVLLAKYGPRIEVDASKVGRIICGENQRLGMTIPMNADSRSTMVFPKGIAHQDEKSLQETNEALATGANPSLVSDLIPFPARLDGLFTDQSPEDFAEADPCLNDRCSDALIVHRVPPVAFEETEPRSLCPTLATSQDIDKRSPDGPPPLDRTEVEKLVEVLHEAASSTATVPDLSYRAFDALCTISSVYGVLPKSYLLTDVTMSSTIPYASGGSTEVWRGQQNGRQVCVKALRKGAVANPDEVKRRLYHEIIGWKHVSHPNVLPILGVSQTLKSLLCIISPWLPNGNILDYTQKNREANRFQLLAQGASGLEYLHTHGIVHGDIRPGNILITEKGSACLGDFGIRRIISATIISAPTVVDSETTVTSKLGAARYMAPELFSRGDSGPDVGNPSEKSDIYSFAITAFEVLSEVLPYGSGREALIVFNIVSGKGLSRPNNPAANMWLPDPIWDVLQHCLDPNPNSRWPVKSLRRAFAKQTWNTLVTENNQAEIHMRGSVAPGPREPGQHRPPLFEDGELTPDTIESLVEVPQSQPPKKKRMLFGAFMAGVRRLGKRPKSPDQPQTSMRLQMPTQSRTSMRSLTPTRPQTPTRSRKPRWSRLRV